MLSVGFEPHTWAEESYFNQLFSFFSAYKFDCRLYQRRGKKKRAALGFGKNIVAGSLVRRPSRVQRRHYDSSTGGGCSRTGCCSGLVLVFGFPVSDWLCKAEFSKVGLLLPFGGSDGGMGGKIKSS